MTHELRYYFNNKQETIYLYSYFVSSLVLIPFVGSADSGKLTALAAIGLWVTLASAIAMGAMSLFKRDQVAGRLDYYQMLPCALEGVVVAKWLAFYVFITVPLLAAIPLAGVLYDLSGAVLGRYALGLLAGAAGLSLLSAVVGAITSGLDKAGAVLSLILLPLSIPVLIFGANYCQHGGVANLVFLFGFALFLLPVLCFVGAYGIRASN
ncbi:MAG: heme exporter protein CcmB [Rickettsiales bacterium]